MRIGLIADTHIPEAGPDVWPQVYQRFREERVNVILHAGDMHELVVLDRLQDEVGVPVYACRGNGDSGGGGRHVVPDDPRLREDWLFHWQGFRVGLSHVMEELSPSTTLEALTERHFGGPCHVVVCGHTHVATTEMIRNVLVVNPGSPMYPRNMNVTLGNIGFLQVESGAIEAWVEPLRPPWGAEDSGIIDHLSAAKQFPDQWVAFGVSRHDPVTGITQGSVMGRCSTEVEARQVERATLRQDPAAVLLTFHGSSPPERGIAQRLLLTPDPRASGAP